VTPAANDINDAGQIVGFFDGSVAPEPSSLMFFSVGLVGLGLAWRRGDWRLKIRSES
jgi:hypothetical protein